MGISGLLPFLKPVTKRTHISSFQGKRVAIDGYSWLHKGAYSCSSDLCLNRPTDKFVTYFLNRVQTVINCGLIPTIVFDGGQLPIKREENESRRNSKKQNFEKGLALLEQGKAGAAEECFQRAVNISPLHAKQVVEALKKKGIRFIVAPYEADAQLAYLAQNDHVDLVITEDSDLLAYACPQVLFKVDKHGYAQHISFEEMINYPTFAGFTLTMFQEMCIFSGCDFLPSVPGIGMKKAYDFVKKLRSHRAVIKRLKYSGFKVPASYEGDFQRALMVFNHQSVFDPVTLTLKHLKEIPNELQQRQAEKEKDENVDVDVDAPNNKGFFDYLGAHYSDSLGHMVAKGDIHPSKLEPFAVPEHQPMQQQPVKKKVYYPNDQRDFRKKKNTIAFSTFQNHSVKSKLDKKVARDNGVKSDQGRLSSYFNSVPAACDKARSHFVTPRSSNDNSHGAKNVPAKLRRKSIWDQDDSSRVAVGAATNSNKSNFFSRRKGSQSKETEADDKQRVISKYFPGRTKKRQVDEDTDGDKGGMDKDASSPSSVEYNSENYLKDCATEARKAVNEVVVAPGSLRSFAFKDLSQESGEKDKQQQPELVSPPRKMHKLSHSSCCKPFQPPSTKANERPKTFFTDYLFKK